MPRQLVIHDFWVSVSVFSEEIHIRIERLSKANGPSHRGSASSNLLRSQIEQKGRGGENVSSFCLNQNPHRLLPLDTDTCFLSFQIQKGPYTISPPDSQAFGLVLNYTTSSPGSPASRQQVVGLLSLRHLLSRFLQQTPSCFCFSRDP